MRAWLCRCAACHRYRRRPNSLHRLRRPSVLGLLRNVSSLVFSPTPIPSPLHLPRRLQATGRLGACVVGVLAARQLASAKRCPRFVPCVFCIFAAFVWNGQSSRASGRKRTGFTVRFMLSVFGLCRGAARKGLLGIMRQFILQHRASSRPRRCMLMTVPPKWFPARV